MIVERGEIFLVNFGDSEHIGREQAKNIRPAVIISNDIANKNIKNDLIMVALISSSSMDKIRVTHLEIPMGTTSLDRPSKIMTEHIRSIDKARLITYKGRLTNDKISEMDAKIQLATGIFDFL